MVFVFDMTACFSQAVANVKLNGHWKLLEIYLRKKGTPHQGNHLLLEGSSS
jgi:hypothetical protein